MEVTTAPSVGGCFQSVFPHETVTKTPSAEVRADQAFAMDAMELLRPERGRRSDAPGRACRDGGDNVRDYERGGRDEEDRQDREGGVLPNA